MENIKEIILKNQDKNTLKSSLTEILDNLKSAHNFDEFNQYIISYANLTEKFYTEYSLAGFRFYGHTSNADYKSILDNCQEIHTNALGVISDIDKFIGSSSHIENLKSNYGENQYFKWKNSQFSINKKAEKLNEEIEQINNTVVAFTSQAKAEWDSEEISFNKLYSYTRDEDRLVRKLAYQKISNHYMAHEDFYYSNFLKIIQLRNEFAIELGFKDFSEYSILLYNRIGYNYENIAKYRNSIAINFKKVFELINELKKQNLDLDIITSYDTVLFKDGPSKLLSLDIKENIEMYKTVLKELNPSWAALFSDMLDNNVIDFESRPDKAFTGFANFFHDIKTPILFLLVQNNSNDIRVLTHEYGHTLQLHKSYKDRNCSSLYTYSLDCIEIFSHSMELLSLSNVDKFFGQDAMKYQLENLISHLAQSITTSIGDEFQEIIYKEKNLSKEFIQATYLNLSKKYKGDLVDSSEVQYIALGNDWMEVPHYFASPFYLIDYSLAIMNALKIYQIFLKDKNKAFAVWEKLADNIGDLNIGSIKRICPELVSPFDEIDVKKIADFAFEELAKSINKFKEVAH